MIADGARVAVIAIGIGWEHRTHSRLVTDAFGAGGIALAAGINYAGLTATVIVTAFETVTLRIAWGTIVFRGQLIRKD